MQLNWITIGIAVLVVLIAFAGYKVFKIMKTLKTNTLEQEPVQTKPASPPIQAKPIPQAVHPVQQPKLAPPSFMKRPPPIQETESEYDEESVVDDNPTEMFNLNEETEFDFKQESDMIIPLNLNNIIKQVVNTKIEKPQSAIIREINDDESDASDASDATTMSDAAIGSRPLDEKDLNRMTIVELKELARQKNIKLTDGRKPKNKETLVKELSNV